MDSLHILFLDKMCRESAFFTFILYLDMKSACLQFLPSWDTWSHKKKTEYYVIARKHSHG
jgi:hypothetical protein